MKLLVLGVSAVAASIGLLIAPIASADPDTDYLDALRAGGFNWAEDAPVGSLVGLGRGICQELDQGASADTITAEGTEQTGWTSEQMTVVIRAATASFCPQHS